MTPQAEFEASLAATLKALRGEGLFRQMRLPHGLDLVSNDYLGFAEHPYISQCMAAALATLPAGSGGSRLLRGHHEVFDRLEARLARVSGSEAALLFSSGYTANVGLLQAIVSPDDLVVSDELNHASLIDGIRLTKARTVVYAHQNLTELEAALKLPRKGRAFVVTESLFSMNGDLTPLNEIAEIAHRENAVLLVDEAHATGLYGARGSGRVEELGLRDRVLATVHTLTPSSVNLCRSSADFLWTSARRAGSRSRRSRPASMAAASTGTGAVEKMNERARLTSTPRRVCDAATHAPPDP
ncbi:MAG TPA: aminotransferase class I/II-fold pyridoxal phosphate-dependent enzyme, partial [Vicinamibacterales bacterium]|nr:aminotransferase class I/II-fold pyridoxal phosphate-dependent enzyme [Vicinamibacterales bacterium]